MASENENYEKLIAMFDAWLSMEKGLSANTVEAYNDDILKLLKYIADRHRCPEEIEEADLHEFLATLYDLGISARTQARIISGIRSFFSFLKITGKVKDNPAALLKMPKLGKHFPDILTVEEIDAMEAAIDVSTYEGCRNRAIVEVMYSCGLRVSEVVSLRISNLFLQEEYIMVEGKGSKQRLVPISETAITLIRDYLAVRGDVNVKSDAEDILFLNRRGSGMSRVMIFYIVKDLCEQCGIHKNISPHSLRHSFATHMLEGGANIRAIQQLLGHESISTTEIYVHIDCSYLRREVVNCHPRSKLMR
ncbi:MAG: site-specific tyrosine recombinase/integron integrase [Candidatus Limisoma sp.]|nr:tyrosine recombinase XerD [bacterium]MDY5827546.1 site-specific tyrosine recombinase/integron integrase [Candidatus Limisoma sp.]